MQSLFSEACLLCGDRATRGQLCASCHTALPYHDQPACPICALPTAGGETCGSCLTHPPRFDETLAAFTFTFPIDAVLHAYKYAGNLALIEFLATPLVERALSRPFPDLLIPMPLHPARLKQRGFNQALEIARLFARRLDVPVHPHACRRIRDTPPQATLKHDQRSANLRGAFACDIPLHGKHVALIDDVMTSGASLGELAKAVRKQGAARISVWVVARTLPH
ncbi:MAG: ComF family protein [Sulfuricella sp.]|nr:ComF family protein [Sulfuricella sp.]